MVSKRDEGEGIFLIKDFSRYSPGLYLFDKRFNRKYIKFVKTIALYDTSLLSHVYKVTKYQVCAEGMVLKIKEREYWDEICY